MGESLRSALRFPSSIYGWQQGWKGFNKGIPIYRLLSRYKPFLSNSSMSLRMYVCPCIRNKPTGRTLAVRRCSRLDTMWVKHTTTAILYQECRSSMMPVYLINTTSSIPSRRHVDRRYRSLLTAAPRVSIEVVVVSFCDVSWPTAIRSFSCSQRLRRMICLYTAVPEYL